jgi:hypothetical protein
MMREAFRFLGHQPAQDAAQAHGLFAELRSHPVVALRRRIAFVEGEIEDFEDGRESRDEIGATRNLELYALLRQSALGAHDALRDRRLRLQEAARDLFRGEAGDEP